MKSFRDLEIYQLAYRLALEIHHLSMRFPRHELYELGSQIRRSSKAIPAHIAEGFGRKTLNEFRHFLIYALSSTDETRVHLDLALDLAYLSIDEHAYFSDSYNLLGKKTNKLISTLS